MAKLAAFAIAIAIAAAAASGACYNRCRFRFCNFQTVFLVGKKPDVAFTGRICSKFGKKIGTVGSTGEAYLFRRGKVIRISKWSPFGLKQPFAASFFKSYSIRKFYKGKFIYFSGIGHETPQQNQIKFLNNRCFFVPLTAYQVLDNNGNVVKNVNPGNPFRDCVAFRTFT